VTSAKILDATITLADIADSAEATLVARAGNVYTSSNQTYSAGTTQAFSATTAGTSTVTRLDIAEPELCGDSQFLAPDGWTYDTNFWTLGFGALFYQGSGTAGKSVTKDINAIAGRTYTVTYEYYLEGVGVQFRANVGGNGGTVRLASGTYTDSIVAGTNGLLGFTVTPLLGGEVLAWVSNVSVYDANSDIKLTNGVVNIGGRTVTWDKIALWDAAGSGGGTSTNATHLGGVAAASYALDADVTSAIAAHNTNASAHTALFAAKQDAATAATDAELALHVTNATPHAAQFAAKQPLDADLTKLATNNGGSLTNLQPFRAAWRLAYGNGSAQWTEVGLGAAGQYLRSAGPAAAPSWYTPAFSATATNVYLADLLDTFTNGNFVVGNGTDLTQRTTAQVKTILGTDTATGIPDASATNANGFLISDGSSWGAYDLVTAKSVLGIGEATNVQFSNLQMAGTSNDIVVSHGGTTWTNDAFLDVLNTVVAGAGGWYSFNIDAQTIDGLDSAAFLLTTSSIDALADVETNGATAGDTLIWDGAKFAPGTLATDTNALEALWDADITTATGTLYGTVGVDITAATGALYTAVETDISTATGTLWTATTQHVEGVRSAAYTAFYTGLTNEQLARVAGDTAGSNYVNSTVANYVHKSGSTPMTGNLNMGGHSITNIADGSLRFTGGASIGAADIARWNAGSLTGATVRITNNLAVAGNLTVGGNLTVTGTLTCAGITLGGVTITNWSDAPASPATPGALTVTVKYDPTSAWSSGTLHLYAWGNSNFTGPTLFNQSYVYADIRGTHTITVTNKETLVGQTWWYAWLDGDGDGTFNMSFEDGGTAKTFYQYPFDEPAALAEHMPITLAGTASAGSIAFWLLDVKGNTPRFGSYVDQSARNDLVTIKDLSVAGTPIIWAAYSRANNFVTERSYLRRDANVTSSFSGRYSIGGFGTDYAYGIMQVMSNATALGSFSWGYNLPDVLNPINANNANAPSAYHPTSGETLTTNVIEFAFTDQWVTYSAMQLEVREDSTTGTQRYYYSGYMENEHYDDGTTRHQATVSGMTAGKTYYWRVRCVYGYPTDGDFKPTAWSTWDTFVYNP
jgi:hypothetical protein